MMGQASNHRRLPPRRGRFGRGLVVAVLMLATAVQAQDIVVIANKAVSGSMSRDQVANIFLGKSVSLPSGGRAQPVDLPNSNPLREQFYSRVTGKSTAEVKAYWARLVFTGMALPPKEASSSAEVRRMVASTPGAVGYVESSAADETVTVIHRD